MAIDSTDKGTSAALYVRLAPQLRSSFKKWAGDSGRSEREIVEGLIRYFLSTGISDSERNAILDGRQIAGIGAVLEAYAWAEHAFSSKRWHRSLEWYQKFERLAGSDSGLLRLAHYKLAYCWIEVAIGLRNEAIVAQSPVQQLERFDDAINACAMSSAINSLECESTNWDDGKLSGTNRVAFNNLAASYSLICQWTIERQLFAMGRPNGMVSAIDDLIRSSTAWLKARQAVYESVLSPMNQAWEIIGRRWRNEVVVDAESILRIDLLATRAMRCIRAAVSDDPRMQPSSARFVVDASQISVDTDLAFMRWDAKFSSEFSSWLQEMDSQIPATAGIRGLLTASSEIATARVKAILGRGSR